MAMSKSLIVIASVFAAGATPPPAHDAGPESISYETDACFGACPVYTVTARADGTGVFQGRRYTAVKGRRKFRVTPSQYRIFAAQLAPFLPRSGAVHYNGAPLCAAMATDQASVDVKWHMPDGSERELDFYYGCDMDSKRAMAERLAKAPDLLPIATFIRARH